MAKGASKSAERNWNARRLSPVNTDDPEAATYAAEQRVREIQTKLHRWARDDPHRRFDDLFNLVADPGFLLVAWDRVRGNKGAATAGVDIRRNAQRAMKVDLKWRTGVPVQGQSPCPGQAADVVRRTARGSGLYGRAQKNAACGTRTRR